MKEGRGVQSIEVGARLLDALASHDGPMMLRDVAKHAEMAPAQAHAYLLSYRKFHLVEQDRESGRYRLGPFALEMGLARLHMSAPLRIADDACVQLSNESGLTILTAVWGAYGPTIISVNEGADQVHIDTRPGTVYSMTGTATGKIFCAYQPAKLVVDTVKAQRAEGTRKRYVGTLADLKSISEELSAIRVDGYSTALSDPIPGINALSAPVFDVNNQLSMVVTLIGNALAMSASTASNVDRILRLAREVSTKLGHVYR